MQYRPEIDGLRALAVIPVILFHAGFSTFDGGFVGVDVFFVISGFLITTIIIAELEKGEFSLIRFYERRARRILPALFATMLISIPVAWALMIPAQLKLFAKSLVATSLFASNFLFWKETNYFGAAAEEKPFLHTWSLAVEEQYYLFFPILLMLLWRFGPRRLLYLIIAIAFASLALSEWGWRNSPTANFFLAPMRIWELLFGSVCAFVIHKKDYRPNEVFAAAGIALILFSIFAFDENTPFPSLYALGPVVGTALIIMFATSETTTGKLLATRWVVGIGLISYSAYLWHQPLFAFARIGFRENLNDTVFLALTVLSFMLAYLSWRYIETPFRKIREKKSLSRKVIFASSLIAGTLIVSIGLIGIKTDGLRELYIAKRLNPQEGELLRIVDRDTQYNLYDYMVDDGSCKFWGRTITPQTTARFEACSKKYRKAIVVLGDSHAMNIYNIVAKSDVYPFVLGVSQGGCRPHKTKKNCQYGAFNKFLTRYSDSIETIIFHQSGSYFIEDTFGKLDSSLAFENNATYSFNTGNIATVSRYLDVLARQAKVVWFGPFVESRIDFTDYNYLFKNLVLNPNSIRIFKELDAVILKTSKLTAPKSTVQYLSLVDSLKIKKEFLKTGDCITYRDTDHFSRCGEDIIAEKLKPLLLELVPSR